MSSLGYGPAYVQTRGGRDWILRVPKHARPGAYTALREAGGHSRGILVPWVCSDLLALPETIGWRVEVRFARNALTCLSLAPSIIANRTSVPH
jgi:hypothetical protein